MLTAESHSLLLKLLRAKTMSEEGAELCKEGQNAPQIRQAVEARVKDRSPFLWAEVEDPDAPFQWLDGIVGPAKASVMLQKAADLPWEVKRHLEIAAVANLRVCLETVLRKLLKSGDTGAELREDALIAAAEQTLLEAVGDVPLGSKAALRERAKPLWPEAVKELWHFFHGGRKHAATRYRGLGDRSLCTYLQRRASSYFQLPNIDVRGTEEQTSVTAQVLHHVRTHGWGTLSGCGGAGKSYILGQIAKTLRAHRVPNEHSLALRCPICEAPFLDRCACGFVQPKGTTRAVRVVFAAPTNRAVAVLQKIAGDESQVCCTLHAMSCMRHEALIDLLVVDESSMLASEHGDIITRCGAAKRAALLLVGDEIQLLPVGAGEIFRPLLKQAALPTLGENLRAQGELRRPIASIRQGSSSEAAPFGYTVSRDSERFQRIFDDLAACEGSSQVLALRNEDRINFCCFCIKKHHSCVAEDDYAACKPSPFFFKPFVGEPVRFQKNTYKPHACRGSIGVITKVEEEVVQEIGKPSKKLYTLEVALSPEGPHVQVQSSGPALGYELRPAFAITVHDSQGGEFDNVHIILPPSQASPLCTLEMLYTAASRARKTLKIWCLNRDIADFEENMAKVSLLRATPFKALLKGCKDGGERAVEL